MADLGLTYDLDTCHRLALDHILGLIAGADWSGQLILRGSMLLTAYARHCQHIVSIEREYVVYDSSPALDAGWIH